MVWMYLDDVRECPDPIFTVVIRTVPAAIAYCEQNGCPVFISFDHDIELYTGMDFVHWLIEKDLDNPGFIPYNFDFDVHSANPVGAKNIRHILQNYLDFRKEQ